ncbi:MULTISPECIES: reverse transcriptase domain-containing protein, partial [unclassified Thiocapsa]|uniref:reverse transcriptase domain-containing protein n=1 Tax=unclassified Thiocapsa TaxID=2641286 RepID=UPI0035AD9611
MALRIDDKAFLRLVRKWLKAGILEPDGRVNHPEEGSPQGGSVSPILANLYLHHALDLWVEDTVKAHCQGAVLLCRYADDFVCAFEQQADAERCYRVLGKRLETFGLEVAAEKTNLIRFSPREWKASGALVFLGFEFRWGMGRWRKPVLKPHRYPQLSPSAVRWASNASTKSAARWSPIQIVWGPGKPSR